MSLVEYVLKVGFAVVPGTVRILRVLSKACQASLQCLARWIRRPATGGRLQLIDFPELPTVVMAGAPCRKFRGRKGALKGLLSGQDSRCYIASEFGDSLG